MRIFGSIAVAILLIGATACGGEAGPASTTAPPGTAVPPTSTTTVTTTTAAVTTTTISAITTSTPVTTSAAADDFTLADGRPATFVAITDDYVAVEVDTSSGEITHTFGQTGTAAEMEAAEEMPPNVLVGAWRVRDGSMIGLSDCCEPAAGRLFFVEDGRELGDDPYSSAAPWNQGWSMAPSPTDNRFATLGYSMEIFDPAQPTENGLGVWIDEPTLGFPSGAPAWARDGSRLYWIAQLGETTNLATLDLATGVANQVTVLSWVGGNQYLEGIGMQASGNLVGFLHTPGAGPSGSTEGVVFSATGDLVATFPIEADSWWGGYDPSGRFLIYVDGQGNVRWQGLGQSGLLAAGFIFASW
jgi:hypothetical protein